MVVAAVAGAITEANLSQVEAAALCRIDQPTLSKILRGKTTSVSLDKLLIWLIALGRPVDITIGPMASKGRAILSVSINE